MFLRIPSPAPHFTSPVSGTVMHFESRPGDLLERGGDESSHHHAQALLDPDARDHAGAGDGQQTLLLALGTAILLSPAGILDWICIAVTLVVFPVLWKRHKSRAAVEAI